ncbi:phage Gp37/Gp68 family protein [Niveispirillum cyanobacteriorum]|uniref:Uncharacterized protein n=1 Tax=Niveispirillum cyanobacteriorum TaxID=1612173 RepID=A0A2K9NI58_9PROT|nr:phage Gp37/Gp68 family protein [Niveispirillum cyanobacteriorum]AUN31985.1 hypothetical protein C0V82_16275 [Niveispirillum cyanobacteriorum]GGE85174.1 hypothetical protein GCM10011317_47990 [Niveispirillum cyanobacteriorum]
MGADSKIEWTDYTFNPWRGCTAISPACDHCYAKTLVEGRLSGDFSQRARAADSTWKQPLAWNRKAAKLGIRKRVFCASLADVFDNQVPDQWRIDLWALIRATPHLDWLLLTKRPQNISGMLPADWGDGWPNVWLGATVENQTEADRRIPHLLRAPAAVRFLSCEPLLGSLDMKRWIAGGRKARKPDGTEFIAPHWYMTQCRSCGWIGSSELCGTDVDCGQGDSDVYCPACHAAGCDNEIAGLDWAICGGESGTGARPMHPAWARSLRDQCEAAGMPFFFKQWGEWQAYYDRDVDDPDWRKCPQTDGQMGRGATRYLNLAGGCGFHGDKLVAFRNVGKKAAGRLLDGRTWDQFPKAGAA